MENKCVKTLFSRMQWQQFWDKQAELADVQQQVGRVSRAAGAVAPQEIAAHIGQLLDLQKHDDLLDVCCGNGALTMLLAPQVAFCSGVDLSPKQIALAQKHYPAGDWHTLPAHKLAQLPRSYAKINLYFSFQYFTSAAEALAVLHALRAVLKPGGCILLGDIPDADRWWVYYSSGWSRLRWLWQRLRGREDMGRFWRQRDLARLAAKAGFQIRFLAEPPQLPFAWYRFDALLTEAAAAAKTS